MYVDHRIASARHADLLRQAEAERLALRFRRNREPRLRSAAGRALVRLGQHLLSEQHRAPQQRGAG